MQNTYLELFADDDSYTNVAIKRVFKQRRERLSPSDAALAVLRTRKNEIATKEALKQREEMKGSKGGRNSKATQHSALRKGGKSRHWYATAASEFEEHRTECAEAYRPRLKESIARFKEEYESPEATTPIESPSEWYLNMVESINNEEALEDSDDDYFHSPTRVRLAGDDEEPVQEGENLPDTVSYEQVFATVARRQKAHDSAALEAESKRSRGQVPIPAQLSEIINKRRANIQHQRLKPSGNDRSNRTGPDFVRWGGVPRSLIPEHRVRDVAHKDSGFFKLSHQRGMSQMFAADIQAEAGRWERKIKEDNPTPEENAKTAEEHALAMTTFAAETTESILKAEATKPNAKESSDSGGRLAMRKKHEQSFFPEHDDDDDVVGGSLQRHTISEIDSESSDEQQDDNYFKKTLLTEEDNDDASTCGSDAQTKL